MPMPMFDRVVDYLWLWASVSRYGNEYDLLSLCCIFFLAQLHTGVCYGLYSARLTERTFACPIPVEEKN